MKKNIILSILFLLFIMTSCSSNSEEIVKPPVDNDITYINHVKTIIDSNCLNCHSNPPVNGAPMSLTTFQNVKNAVIGLGLINRVENGTMPPAPAGDLTTTQVQTIKDWEAGGFKE